jgi:hypothetical protein
VINAIGIKGGGAALNAMHDVAFFKQKLSKVGAILAGDAGDQCDFLSAIVFANHIGTIFC